MIAKTPKPPYYAVIFTNLRTEIENEYAETAARMVALAAEQDGFLGEESVRNGLGITISYWRDEEAIAKWRKNAEHRIAQERGRAEWYAAFKTRVCKVERDYEFEK
jgi:heme-degrading monooxygenase HmoA